MNLGKSFNRKFSLLATTIFFTLIVLLNNQTVAQQPPRTISAYDGKDFILSDKDEWESEELHNLLNSDDCKIKQNSFYCSKRAYVATLSQFYRGNFSNARKLLNLYDQILKDASIRAPCSASPNGTVNDTHNVRMSYEALVYALDKAEGKTTLKSTGVAAFLCPQLDTPMFTEIRSRNVDDEELSYGNFLLFIDNSFGSDFVGTAERFWEEIVQPIRFASWQINDSTDWESTLALTQHSLRQQKLYDNALKQCLLGEYPEEFCSVLKDKRDDYLKGALRRLSLKERPY